MFFFMHNSLTVLIVLTGLKMQYALESSCLAKFNPVSKYIYGSISSRIFVLTVQIVQVKGTAHLKQHSY